MYMDDMGYLPKMKITRDFYTNYLNLQPRYKNGNLIVEINFQFLKKKHSTDLCLLDIEFATFSQFCVSSKTADQKVLEIANESFKLCLDIIII